MLDLVPLRLRRVATTAWGRLPELADCRRVFTDWQLMVRGYLGLPGVSYPFTVRFRNGDRIEIETRHDLVTVWVTPCSRSTSKGPSMR